jgi:hypothetical protein
MSTFQCFRLSLAALLVCASHPVAAQTLGVNPSGAPSDVRSPSSTNPAAAASDIRNPSATNPSAAASQIPQAGGIAMPRTNLTPPTPRQRIAPLHRRSRAVDKARERRPAARRSAGEGMTRPFEALEGARRDRIEFEKRAAQDKAVQLRLEREQRAKQTEAPRQPGTPDPRPGTTPSGSSRNPPTASQ